MEDEGIVVDTLFVALTRPATVFGVPLNGFAFEMMLTSILFLGSNSLFSLFAPIPIHAVLYLVCLQDPSIFDNARLWTITSGKCQNRFFWKSTSFSPLETKIK